MDTPIPATPAGHDKPAPRTLSAFADSPLDEGFVVRLAPDGDDAIVLGRPQDGTVEIFQAAAGLTTRDASTPAMPVLDPADREAVIWQALTTLNAGRRNARTEAERLRQNIKTQRDEHVRTLDHIREYAITEHRKDDSTICRDGLNEFLRTFGLPEYQPRIRVHYTITGSYEVDDDGDRDDDDVTSDATGDLQVDYGSLDVIDRSEVERVVVTHIERIPS